MHENLRFRFSGAICCREKIARDWGVNALGRRRPNNFIVEKKKGDGLMKEERLGPIDHPGTRLATAPPPPPRSMHHYDRIGFLLQQTQSLVVCNHAIHERFLSVFFFSLSCIGTSPRMKPSNPSTDDGCSIQPTGGNASTAPDLCRNDSSGTPNEATYYYFSAVNFVSLGTI